LALGLGSREQGATARRDKNWYARRDCFAGQLSTQEVGVRVSARLKIFSVVAHVVWLGVGPAQAWEPDTGGDHLGQDWILADGDVVAGVHVNVGRFVIPADVQVQVRPRQGEEFGALEVRCCELELLGRLVADGAGHPGGQPAREGGGHQGAGPGGGCGGGPGSCVAQGASGGGYGGTGGQPEQETNWNEPCARCDNPVAGHCSGPGGPPYGTMDGPDLEPGSGGGASGNSCGCNGAGAVGGRGGGGVVLLSDGPAHIDGTISVNGEVAPLDDSDCGYHPGGGGGAGGGVLIQAAAISGGGVLSAQGGRGGEADGCPSSCGDWAWAGGGGGGGRIKLFTLDDRFAGTLQLDPGAGGPAPAGNAAFDGLPGEAGTVFRGAQLPFELDGCAGPPRVRLPDAMHALEGTPVRIEASGRDPDGGELHWSWDLDGDEVFDDAEGPTVEQTYPDDGDYPIGVAALDDEGQQVVASGSVRVANVAPTINSQAPGDGVEGQPWQYRVRASDPAGELDPLRVALELAPDGMSADGLRVSWTPTWEQALTGFALVRLSVHDDDGGHAEQAFRVELTWADADADGMADSWELSYGLDPGDPADADGDLDEDGLTNLEEFLARSDPSRFGRPDPPQPVAPADGSWVLSAQPALIVAPADDPDGDPLRYSFELSTDPDFRQLAQQGQDVPPGAEQIAWTVPRPLRENAAYWWRARASDGTFLSEPGPAWRFTVNAVPEPPGLPTLLTPPDGAPVNTPRPTFEVAVGDGDPDGEPLRLHWAVYAGLTLDAPAQEGWLDVAEAGPQATVAWSPEQDLQEDQVYRWRVELVDQGDMSSGWTEPFGFKLNQDNGAPPAPTLASPSDGATLQDQRVELGIVAGPDPDSDPITVLVQLDARPDFGGPDRLSWEDLEPGPDGRLRLDAGRLEDNTRYWWRARSSDGLNQSPWAGATFLVNQANEAPSAPTPWAPDHRAEVTTGTPQLVVVPALDPDLEAVLHRFQVASDPEFQHLLAESEELRSEPPLASPTPDVPEDPEDPEEEPGEDPPPDPEPPATLSWTVDGTLERGGPYYWRCRGRDALRAVGPWSSVRRFTVVAERRPPESTDAGTDGPDAGSSFDPDDGSSPRADRGCTCTQSGGAPGAALLSLLVLAGLLHTRRRVGQ